MSRGLWWIHEMIRTPFKFISFLSVLFITRNGSTEEAETFISMMYIGFKIVIYLFRLPNEIISIGEFWRTLENLWDVFT